MDKLLYVDVNGLKPGKLYKINVKEKYKFLNSLERSGKVGLFLEKKYIQRNHVFALKNIFLIDKQICYYSDERYEFEEIIE